MKKIIATISENFINGTNAGSKAKDDIISIAQKTGYESMIISNPPTHFKKLKFLIQSFFGGLKSTYSLGADVILFQYAGYFNFTTDIALKAFRKYNPNAKLILLVHDVSSLRYQHDKDWQREFKVFNAADVLIVHNQKMLTWLQEHGIQTPMVNLEIFDYLTDLPINDNDFNHKIVFAGNLEKSAFLTKLDIQTSLDLFGPKPASNYPKNITYQGIKKPAELAQFLTQSFGLVWDGNSIDKCNGLMGNYERYNDPHKVSLYLSSGLPVILWQEAAMADFITKNGLGITIEKLSDLDETIDKITPEEFNKMKQNVHTVAKELRAGKHTLDAITKAEKM